jgi:hypothetical protein
VVKYYLFQNVDFLAGVGNLQRTSSQRSNLTYQRNNYALNTAATYAEPYRPIQYRVQECNYNRLQHTAPADDGTTRSPSIDSIQKDPRQVPVGSLQCYSISGINPLLHSDFSKCSVHVISLIPYLHYFQLCSSCVGY